MSNVAVEKVKDNRADSPGFFDKLETLADRIRQRAYEIFQQRESSGSEIGDWLQAERDLVVATTSEMIEKDGKYEIRVAAPGFKPNETTVTVYPDAVVVSAESTHQHEENDGAVHFCDFGGKALYRRLNLPKHIDVDKVTAKLEDGVLRITAQKAGNPALVKTIAA